MDTDPSVTSKPGVCKLGIEEEKVSFQDEETLVHDKDIQQDDAQRDEIQQDYAQRDEIQQDDAQRDDIQQDDAQRDDIQQDDAQPDGIQHDLTSAPSCRDTPLVCKSDCHWPASSHRHQHHNHYKGGGLSRIGQYGLGAWKIGRVTNDVILDKI
eukprot:gene4702-5320_t